MRQAHTDELKKQFDKIAEESRELKERIVATKAKEASEKQAQIAAKKAKKEAEK